MKERNKKEALILTLVCLICVLAVSIFGLFVIKDAYSEVGLKDEGFRNLTQVKVHSLDKSGMGVVIGVEDEYIDILTTKHLTDASAVAEAEFGNGGYAEGYMVYFYPEHDAAVLRIKREDSDPDFKGAKKAEVLSKSEYEKLSLSQKVYYLSDLTDTGKKFETGKWLEGRTFIYEIQEEVGLFEGEVIPGMSGEGLYDENDRMVGMIIAASDKEGAVTPAYILESEYLKWRMNEGE